jgi:hypothetical protein
MTSKSILNFCLLAGPNSQLQIRMAVDPRSPAEGVRSRTASGTNLVALASLLHFTSLDLAGEVLGTRGSVSVMAGHLVPVGRVGDNFVLLP